MAKIGLKLLPWSFYTNCCVLTVTMVFLSVNIRSSSLNIVLTYNIVKIILLADIQSVINAALKSKILLIPRASVNHEDICSSTYSHTTVTKYPWTGQFIAGRELCLNLFLKRFKTKQLNLWLKHTHTCMFFFCIEYNSKLGTRSCLTNLEEIVLSIFALIHDECSLILVVIISIILKQMCYLNWRKGLPCI